MLWLFKITLWAFPEQQGHPPGFSLPCWFRITSPASVSVQPRSQRSALPRVLCRPRSQPSLATPFSDYSPCSRISSLTNDTIFYQASKEDCGIIFTSSSFTPMGIGHQELLIFLRVALCTPSLPPYSHRPLAPPLSSLPATVRRTFLHCGWCHSSASVLLGAW